MSDAVHGDKEGPKEDHDGEVFRDGEVLECQSVGELRNQHADVEEGGEVVELLIGEVVVWEEAEDGGGRNCVLVEELDCRKMVIN
jgi:hypothetical protein